MGIFGGEDRRRWLGGHPRLGARSGREAVQGVPRRVGEYEARVTRAAFAAGVPAPAVLDEVTLEGRFGIVLSRLDGPTLVQLLRTGAMTPDQAGAILASLCLSVHKIQRACYTTLETIAQLSDDPTVSLPAIAS